MSKIIKKPSILNWMGTLFLLSIPGVNLIALLLFAIFAKTQAKRSFAIAGILLAILYLAAVFAAFALFPDFFTRLADTLRGIPTARLGL